MKKSFVILFLITLAFITEASAQVFVTDKNPFGRWKIGKEVVLAGNRMMRIEGENMSNQVTNIKYQTAKQIKADYENRAAKEMWTEAQKSEQLAEVDANSPGGQISLFIKRLTIDEANNMHFTVIIQNKTGEELYRENLDELIPESPLGLDPLWWNIGLVEISKFIDGPFYIYVIDGLQQKKFKFEYLGEMANGGIKKGP